MQNLLDDYFNVHNTFQIVVQRAGPASVLVGDYQCVQPRPPRAL